MKKIEEFTPKGPTITELTSELLILRNQVDVYQKEIIPGFRDRAEQAEAREKVLRDALKPFAWFGERAKQFIPRPNMPDDWSIKTDRMKFVRAYEVFAGDNDTTIPKH